MRAFAPVIGALRVFVCLCHTDFPVGGETGEPDRHIFQFKFDLKPRCVLRIIAPLQISQLRRRFGFLPKRLVAKTVFNGRRKDEL